MFLSWTGRCRFSNSGMDALRVRRRLFSQRLQGDEVVVKDSGNVAVLLLLLQQHG